MPIHLLLSLRMYGIILNVLWFVNNACMPLHICSHKTSGMSLWQNCNKKYNIILTLCTLSTDITYVTITVDWAMY